MCYLLVTAIEKSPTGRGLTPSCSMAHMAHIARNTKRINRLLKANRNKSQAVNKFRSPRFMITLT